jgi:hypothetical protein
MNTPHEHPDANPEAISESLPSDLVAIARAVDRLAALDAAAMPHDLCERIASSTATRLMAREVTRLDTLGGADQAAASSTLEDRVFMATRGLINTAGVRVHEPADRRDGAARPRRFSVAGRFALAAALLLAGGLTFITLRSNINTNTTSPTTTTTQVASAIQSDLDDLAALVDSGDGRDDVAGLNVALGAIEEALDGDLLKSALDDGGSL